MVCNLMSSEDEALLSIINNSVMEIPCLVIFASLMTEQNRTDDKVDA